MPTTTQISSATTTTVAPFSTPIPAVPTSRIPVATRPHDALPQRRPVTRRMTTTDANTRPPSSVVNGFVASEHGANESDIGTHVSSRRASWVKRLSAISVSQQSSRNPSPAQSSPAVTYSNGSVAFSHDDSIVPMMRRQTPPQLPPNKLVKRSSSVRVPRDIQPTHGTGSLRPSFRRPATSHQRSATLQNYRSLLPVTRESPSLEVKPSSASTDSEAEYAHFFTATSLRGRRLSKRFQTNPTKIRRIFPDEKHQPTLVLARAVTTGVEELEESASEAGESVFYVSRPGTPLSYTAAVAAPRPGVPQLTTNTLVRPATAVSSTVVSEDASRRRRSFSIADLLPSGSSAKKQRLAKQAGMKLTRGSSQRVSSDPVIPTMGKRSNTAYGELPTRRNLTDPAPPKRDIFASGVAESSYHRNGATGGSSTSPLSTLSAPRREMTVAGNRLASMPQLEAIASAAPATNQAPPSPSVLAQAGVRPSRHSMAASEQASTLVGSSDNEVRAVGSVDGEDADLRSETLYDSLRTGVTRSVSGGARGPRIETIFDESPPAKLRVTALRDLLPSGTFGDSLTNGTSDNHSIAQDDDSLTIPARTTVRPEHHLREAVSFSRPSSTAVYPSLIPSSPPSMPKPLSLGTLEWDSTVGDDDQSSRWSLDEQEGEDPWVDHPPVSHLATPITLRRSNPRLLASVPNTKPSTPQHSVHDHTDRDARSSIFDWSEQQPADKSSGNRTPPRPRTVHGKKDANRRDSRSVGRRAPSGLHARSQSVPVVPDVVGKRNTVVTNKFGTWGIGSKGVTEDWNDDFDFSELPEEPTPKSVAGSHRIDSGSAMVVPKSIQEQQNNVLANISLLREWGLLIEELKEHRIRGISLGIVEGSHSGMWEEVDAMIDLADQEAEHQEVPRASPPSSPGFDEDAFDDVSASPNLGRGRRKSGSPNDDLTKTHTVRPRKSILPPNDRIFGPQTSPVPLKPKYETPATPESKPIITRPRKDSEAKARSVIEALQSRKSVFESPANAPPTPSPKKVPFDTATLRRIVPYVSTLTRKVKDTIRDAEGLYYSPTTSPQHEEPPFAMSPFQQDAELASHMKLMTVM